jgi:hypothetical protein
MGGRESHVGEHVGFALVHQGGPLGEGRPELIGDLAPLALGCLGVVLGEGRRNEGRDHPWAASAGVDQSVAGDPVSVVVRRLRSNSSRRSRRCRYGSPSAICPDASTNRSPTCSSSGRDLV